MMMNIFLFEIYYYFVSVAVWKLDYLAGPMASTFVIAWYKNVKSEILLLNWIEVNWVLSCAGSDGVLRGRAAAQRQTARVRSQL